MEPQLLIDTLRTMTVILGGLTIGYTLRKGGHATPEHGTRVNRLTLSVIQPLVIGLALWNTSHLTWQTLLLPLYGIALVGVMWPVSAAAARLLGLDRPARGAFVSSGMFSNVGFTFGTFLAYIALGPAGAALGALYCVSFMPAFFTLGFYVGRRYAPGHQTNMLQALGDMARDSQTRNPVLGILVGLALNLLRAPVPEHAEAIIDVAMPATTAAYLLAIGLGLRLSTVGRYWRESAALSVLKFVISPVLGLGLAWLFGYWQSPDHQVLQVVFLQAATPSAIMAIMLADVFSLNRDLAGALWLVTNVLAVFLAPLLLLIARAL